MAVEPVCQPPLIIILYIASPCFKKSGVASTLNEWVRINPVIVH